MGFFEVGNTIAEVKKKKQNSWDGLNSKIQMTKKMVSKLYDKIGKTILSEDGEKKIEKQI